MRFIGLDVHRDLCEVAISEGGKARLAGRIATTPSDLELFARSLGADDQVVLEATGNALAIARIVGPHVAEVVLAHAKHIRAISHAKVENDQFDARTLAELLAADLIPRVWIGDQRTRVMRRRVIAPAWAGQAIDSGQVRDRGSRAPQSQGPPAVQRPARQV